MLLLERDAPLELLKQLLSSSTKEGHCVLVAAEAGMGKTSLLKALKEELENRVIWLEGNCDALFTPRPLGPVYDLVHQIKNKVGHDLTVTSDRSDLFSGFLQALEQQTRRLVITMEDIHWADEATLDFIKFLGRRIHRISGLLILTYRDNELHAEHPLRHVLGQMPINSVTRIGLPALTKETVVDLSKNKGYDGEELYRITGGNPFYVTEILQAVNEEVPRNVKDSILSGYYKLNENCRHVIALLSTLPGGLFLNHLHLLEENERSAVHDVSELNILVLDGNRITFKHELYRITIETSISPFVRIDLNKRVLELFKDSFDATGEIERIVHHAKAANDHNIVVEFAPQAAQKAAGLGAHTEAAKLYRTAIDFYQGRDAGVLLQFYERYAYECFLTNQLKEAIIYATKALRLLNEKNDVERTVQCLNLLVKMLWFDGRREQSLASVEQACKMMENEPPSATKTIALTGRAYLQLLADQTAMALSYGEQSLAMANALGIPEVECFALTPVGIVLYRDPKTRALGWEKLSASLEIALTNGFHEQVGLIYLLSARADIYGKNYNDARKLLDAALDYCEHSELMLNLPFLQGLKAWLEMDLGNWDFSQSIARTVLETNVSNALGNIEASCVLARIAMRKGDPGVLELLDKANRVAQQMEPFLFVVVTTAYLEFEWITGTRADDHLVEKSIAALTAPGCAYPAGEFAFWYRKARKTLLPGLTIFEGYETHTQKKAKDAATVWRKLGCPYQEALALFDGGEDDKRAALEMMDKLHATAVFEKMKFLMRSEGIKQLPRGIRASTRSNSALLTKRELDVLGLLKEGLGNKEIANRLFLSAKTVDHHISSILFKLDVSSRVKAVIEAERLNLLR